MKRWGVLIGIAVLSGLGALVGGLSFLLLYKTLEPGLVDEHRFDDHDHGHGDEHAPWADEHVQEPSEEAVGEETPDEAWAAMGSTEMPSFVVQITGKSPHPEIDRRLLGSVSWGPCSKHKGAVTIMAMRVDDELVSPVVVGEDPNNRNVDLEECVAGLLSDISVSGVPSDYFMLEAELRIE